MSWKPRNWILGLSFVLTLISFDQALAKRVALVIGNGDYANPANDLINPTRDARDIAAKFEGFGIETITALDQDFRGMRVAISRFARALEGAEAGIFYYAGHGMEYRRSNFLFPTDAELKNESDIQLGLIDMDDVLRIMEELVPTSIIFLDACRDNPMARTFRRGGSASRSAAVGRGLAPMNASVGTFIAYATAPGELASDGSGVNSPFTSAMLRHLDEPGLELSQLMRKVRNTVLDETGDRQIPWERSSLRGAPIVLNQQTAPPVFSRADLQFWETIESSQDPADYRAFLDRFPESSLAPFIRSRLASLETQSEIIEAPDAVSNDNRTTEQGKTEPETVIAALPAPEPEPDLPAIAAKGPRKPGEIFADCPNCPDLVAIPPGDFTQGSPANEAGRRDDEMSPRSVSIENPLAVGRTEVTFAQWEACLAGGGCDGYQPHDEGWGRGNRPVINVSYQNAQAYVTWLSRTTGKPYRLLSEAEWEYAARAGSTAPNEWSVATQSACHFANIHDRSSGLTNGLRWRAFDCDDGAATTASAGSYVPNGFGLYDMLGNVWEWTADCYKPEDRGADCKRYTLKGGSFRDRIDQFRFAARVGGRATSQTSYDGFRIVRDLVEGMDGNIAVGNR